MENKTVEIITLPPGSWQAYKQIRLESLCESPLAFGTSYLDQAAKPDVLWQARLEEANQGVKIWLLFARQNGKIVGMIGAYRPDFDNNPKSNRAEIVQVYVSPEARGSGVGGRLMEGILSVLKDNDIRVATLGVSDTQKEAVRLYERYGFRTVRTESHILADGQEHLGIFMEMDLQ